MTVTTIIRSLARRYLPPSWRPLNRFTAYALDRTQGVVLGGPFRGMRYVERSVGSVLLPKLLGTYERELDAAIHQLKDRAPRHPIVVGAAEGFYAVGIARWDSVERVEAFEAQLSAHRLIADLAERNGVAHKVKLHGLCDCSTLNQALSRCRDAHPVIIVDVEGAEAVLLDPAVVPRLRESVMLVEVHDAFVPGLADRLQARFSSTHRIERIDAVPRRLSDLPKELHSLPTWTGAAAVHAMNEGRPPGMYWWLMVPRTSEGESTPQGS